MPEPLIEHLMRARAAEEGIVKRIAQALLHREREPHVLKTRPGAFLERQEGTPGSRQARGHLKRVKPSQGRTRGRETWIKQAKAKHKAARGKG